MTQTLFVHIGPHKTGSTALQVYTRLYKLPLRLMGLANPRLDPSERTRNYDILREVRRSRGSFAGRQTYLDYVSGSSARAILITEEALYSQPAAVDYFAPFKALADVKIIFMPRRQDRFLESMYKQRIKNSRRGHFGPTFEEYAQTTIADWATILAPWEAAFGIGSIHVIPYDDRAYVSSLAALAKIPGLGTLKRFPLPFTLNQSLACETVEVMRQARADGFAVDRSKAGAFEKRLPSKTYAYLDVPAREELLARYRDANRQLAERYGFDPAILCEIGSSRAQARVFDLRGFDLAAHLGHARSCGLIGGRPELDQPEGLD